MLKMESTLKRRRMFRCLGTAFAITALLAAGLARAESFTDDPPAEIDSRCFVRLLFEDQSVYGYTDGLALLEYREVFGAYDPFVQVLTIAGTESWPVWWVETYGATGTLTGRYGIRSRSSVSKKALGGFDAQGFPVPTTIELFIPLSRDITRAALLSSTSSSKSDLSVPWRSLKCEERQ